MWELTSENWSAIGTWAAVGVAAVAAVFALRQVHEARLTRDEQAQPSVVMYSEPMAGDWQFLELVIKNFGLTPAYDIQVSLDSAPKVSPDYEGADPTEVAVPTRLPILAPGQEWRALWDHAPSRFQCEGLESRHIGQISYRGDRKKKVNWYQPWRLDYDRFSTPVELNFELLKDTRRVSHKTMNDAAQTLEDELAAINKGLAAIAQTLDAFSADSHKGIWVYPVDSDAELRHRGVLQRKEAARRERARRVHDRLLAQILPPDEQGGNEDDSENVTPTEPNSRPAASGD